MSVNAKIFDLSKGNSQVAVCRGDTLYYDLSISLVLMETRILPYTAVALIHNRDVTIKCDAKIVV